MTWKFVPKIISGELVQLEPLEWKWFEEVCEAMIPDPDGWYSVMFGLNSRDGYKKEFVDADNFMKKKTGLGFAIRDLKSGQFVGISFFLRMDPENRTLEIGTTNIAPRFRRTYVNTATKLLMLEEAFETLNCVRVSFRIDEENTVSRKAIERIGATYGGLLRNERILPNGKIRNYCHYDITKQEWPKIKSRLIERLSKK